MQAQLQIASATMVYSTDPQLLIRVTDLKNYVHCPRFPYYEACLPDVRPRTFAMDAGDEAHVIERARARRRTLWAYGLPKGERHFNVRLFDPARGLSGMVDELVIAPAEPAATSAFALYPVDYKLSTKVTESFELQVCAYALLLEAVYAIPVTRGYIYLIGQRQLHAVDVTAARRAAVETALENIRAIIKEERMPPPVKQRAKCRACEWRRFCNDVV